MSLLSPLAAAVIQSPRDWVSVGPNAYAKYDQPENPPTEWKVPSSETDKGVNIL
jgi:hypothetical protein